MCIKTEQNINMFTVIKLIILIVNKYTYYFCRKLHVITNIFVSCPFCDRINIQA